MILKASFTKREKNMHYKKNKGIINLRKLYQNFKKKKTRYYTH